MIGISSYGAYVPRTRLPLAMIGGHPAKDGGPEKAVAWNDEDSVTMAVTAGVNCLEGLDRSVVDGVLFASTTYAFGEKQASALIARALDLRREVRTADYSGSLRAGTSALRAAFDAVTAGSARNVLVIASDSRMAAPGSTLETNFGDGAAAFLVSDTGAVATLEGSHSVADEIVDVWRSEGDPFVHSWEDRFVVQEGYIPRISEAVEGLLEATGSKLEDFTKLALYAPDARSHRTVARAIGASPEQLQGPLFGRLGNTGAAFAPMQLAAALETASSGARLLVASYGDGAEALAFRVTDQLEKLDSRRGVGWHLERRRPATSYDGYLKARSLKTTEWDAGSAPGLSATVHFRERDDDLSLRGQKCRNCSATQFPAQRVCESCFARDDFESVRLSDRIGKVVTYTFDYFFPTPDPPTVVTVTEVDGARLHLQLVNCTPEETEIGLSVEFVFRRIHMGGGRPNYYWKGSPVPGEG
ncbi:MAG: zinc ribbon domain-containing protein [Myxococcota bacterium]